MQKNFHEELLELINSDLSNEEKLYQLENYHYSDIVDVLEILEKEDRLSIYLILGIERTAELFSFYNDVEEYIKELTPELAASIVELMDSNDAVDVLNELEEEDKDKIIELMEEEAQEIVKKIDSYDEELIGSYMSDNFITIPQNSTIKSAMSKMVASAGEHDNIFMLYVVDDDNKLVGAVELKDLIVSRKDDSFEDLIMTSYPSFYDDEVMSECIEKIKDYSETSIPVTNRNGEILGVLTIDSLIEATVDEFEEDYAKLGGLTEEEDMDEPVRVSIKKRLPWLIVLLFLGLIVSSVVGVFEAVIATVPVIVFFQSMILGMAGNVGTQSLAVTIRNISNESLEEDKAKQRKNIFKELKIGFSNGLFMGIISFVFVLLYLFITKQEISAGSGYVFNDSLMVSGIIGVSMLVAITLASIIGTVFPLLLAKLHIDPAVASGPFITTMNDIVAVLVYYGLTYLLFIVFM